MKRWLAIILTVCMLAISAPAMADPFGWETENYGGGIETFSWEGEGFGWEGEGVIEDERYWSETPLYGSESSKLHNIRLAVESLDGAVVYSGETFSFNAAVGPRSEEEGYLMAKNGRGARVRGGGVSQLASTLYLALKDAPAVEILPFMSYDERFTDWYVADGSDAVVTDYNTGHDFCFTSNYEGTIYIDAWMDDYYVYCMLTYDDSGSYSTMLSRSSTPIFGSENKIHNLTMAADAINGIMLEYGDSFSFNWIVGARTAENGYLPAENGRGVRVYGGGVAQAASTVYLAVKELNCIELDPIRTYGERFVDGYVADSNDAIVTDYNAGIDFSFTYRGYGTAAIYIFREGDRLVCEIYEY